MPTSNPTIMNQFWINLKTEIATAWPEIAGKLSQDTAIERQDWTNLLNDGELGVPWCVVKMSPSPLKGWGTIPRLQIDFEITYIDGIKAVKTQSNLQGKQTTAAVYVMDKLIVLKEQLFKSQICGTVLDDVKFNANAENPANDIMIESGWDYQCATLTMQALVVNATG